MPPIPIHGPVAGDAPGVVTEDGGLGKAGGVRGAVPVGVDGSEASGLVGGEGKESAARFGGLGPEGAVFGRSPAGPELVEGGQVVGGVGEGAAEAVRNEANHLVGFVNFGGFVAVTEFGGADDALAVEHGVKEGVGFAVVVVDALTVAPAG